MTDQLPAMPKYVTPSNVPAGSDQGFLDDESFVSSAPWLRMGYALSQSVQDGNCKQGHYYSEAHETQLEYPFECIFLKWENRWTVFSEDGNLEWSSDDPQSDEVQALGDEEWTARRIRAIVCVKHGDEYRPEIVSFHKSTYKVGQTIYKMIKKSGAPNVWSVVFKCTGADKKEKSATQYSFIPKFTFKGWAPEKDLEALATMAKLHGFSAAQEGPSPSENEEESPF